jgi:thiamine biosynthesis lipoprotein
LNYVGSDNIISKANRFSKKNPKLELDFGAIAKGYAVDRISDYLIDKGYLVHYVEIGGEIICKGKDWNIQIAYPEFLSNKSFKILKLNNKAVATSGTYNQFVEIDDFEYSHIFDSRVGRPVKNNVVSVTVISDNCIDTDALSTSLKVLGKDKGLELINELDNIECMFILKESGVLKDYYSNNFLSFLID